jgi:hypothetical protein
MAGEKTILRNRVLAHHVFPYGILSRILRCPNSGIFDPDSRDLRQDLPFFI